MDVLYELKRYLETGECDKFIELLNQPPNINIIIDNHGTDLLYEASHRRRLVCMQELIAHGVDINCQRSNYTILLSTLSDYFSLSLTDQDCYQIVKYLISVASDESGADCNRHYHDGEDLLQFFCWFIVNTPKYGYIKEILGLLIDHGANREYVYKGQTVDTYLRLNGEYELADFICDYQPVPETKGVYDG
jgi:ankyrin repeat protein